MPGESATLGVQICRALGQRGVRTIFGIPGVHNQELYRGVSLTGLEHVLARHEQGAGFMADGYARATGRPGVAFVISGPGLTNVLTPVGQARSDSVPMLVLAACLDEATVLTGSGGLHELKNQSIAGDAVADWSLTAPDVASVFLLIDRAFNEFSCSRPGPKIINIPVPLLSQSSPPPKAPPVWSQWPVAPESQVQKVAELLGCAQLPLFVFGGGAASASEAARVAVERTSSAVFLTYAGRGVIAPGYSLNLGSKLARPESTRQIAKADLVIAVGTRLSETDLWREQLGHDCPMVRVDIDPGAFLELRDGDLPVLSEAGSFLESLNRHLPAGGQSSGWDRAEFRRFKDVLHNSCAAERPGIAKVAMAVADLLPERTLIYSDMTQFAYVAKEVVDLKLPGRWHHPYGFGTLGYALPAAIGGKVADPDSPVLAIAGDYGLQYTIQELATLADIQLPITILVWDNDGLQEIEHSMIEAQIPPTATGAFLPDLELLSRAFNLGY